MTSVVNLPGNPVEIEFGFEQAQEFISEPFFKDMEEMRLTTFEDDILGKRQLAFSNNYGKGGKADTGCGLDFEGSLTFKQKFWDPVPIKDPKEQCWNDLFPSLIQYANKGGVARKDLTQNDIFMALQSMRLKDQLVKDVHRRMWFSDTSFVDGDFTNGATDKVFYNIYNGLWQQIFESVDASESFNSPITENGEATIPAQLALAADRAFLVFIAMVEGADTRLTDQGDQVIGVTKTLYDNFASFLESKDTFNSFSRIEDGFTTLNFRGIPIVRMASWDRHIQADFKTGAPVYDLPHRALLTSKQNLHMGVDRSRSLTDIEQWYDRDQELWKSKSSTMEDAKLIHGFMTATAY